MSKKTASPPITDPPTGTIGAIPLNTQFVGASQCGENHLTMLGAYADQVWLNEPYPASGLTTSDCYPTEIMASLAQTTTLLPVFSPLLCPDWYTTISKWEGNYIACCPKSYTLHLTTGPTPPGRSAFNATCFSNLVSQTTVTAYDSVTITSTQGYNDPTAQAYAHALDGYAPATAQSPQITVVAGPDPDVTSSTASRASQGLFTATDGSAYSGSVPTPSSSNHISGAAIAGIVVGAFAFCLIATLLAWIIFLLRRRRRGPHHNESSGYYSQNDKLQPSTLSSISAPTMSSASRSPHSISAPALVHGRQPRSRPQERQGRPQPPGQAYSKVDEAMHDAASSIADFGPASPTSIRGFETAASPDTMQSPPPRFSHVVRQDQRRQRAPRPAEIDTRTTQRYELGDENAPWATARRKEQTRPARTLVELPGDKPWRG